MKPFLAFIQKEFNHIFRDMRTLLILLVMPIALMIIFGFAITTEIKENKIAIFDQARDESSQNLINRFRASAYFHLVTSISDSKELEQVFSQNRASLVLVIPSRFNQNLRADNLGSIQIISDGSDPNTSTSLVGYASTIIGEYEKELGKSTIQPYQIAIQNRMLYNPELKGAFTFVPGVMGLILLLISTMMTSVSIAKEKELGTMEVLLVSPLNAVSIIFAKAIPYLLVSMVNVGTILTLSVFVLKLPIAGSLILLLLESILFTAACLSLGMLISTSVNTQQAALLISLLGLMLPTMMLSGFIFPVQSMPTALQLVSKMVPATWYIIMVKSIMLKGLGFSYIWKENLILLGMTLGFLGFSIVRFKIRLQ